MLTVQIHLLLIFPILPYILDVLEAVGSSGTCLFPRHGLTVPVQCFLLSALGTCSVEGSTPFFCFGVFSNSFSHFPSCWGGLGVCVFCTLGVAAFGIGLLIMAVWIGLGLVCLFGLLTLGVGIVSLVSVTSGSLVVASKVNHSCSWVARLLCGGAVSGMLLSMLLSFLSASICSIPF